MNNYISRFVSGILTVMFIALGGMADGAPYQLSLSAKPDAGLVLQWPTVVDGIYLLESTTLQGGTWQPYPMSNALLASATAQLSVTIPNTDQKRFFRVPFLGSSSTNAANLNSNSWVTVNGNQTLQRSSVSIEPMTGAWTNANNPSVRLVQLPVWAPGKGLRRVAGTNYINGVNCGGQIFGTPSLLGQGALYVSTNEGVNWSFCCALPIQNKNDYIMRVSSIAFGSNEVLLASMNEGALYLSTNLFATRSANMIPSWYAAVGPKTAFNGNILVEAVAGRAVSDCYLLTCLYGGRLEGTSVLGCIYVLRTDKTLAQIVAGNTPQLKLVWKQDAFDFYARHVSGTIVVTNHVGLVSATTNTLQDSAGIFGNNDTSSPRCVRIMSGTGAGQSRMITANTANTLTLYTSWQVLPDATSDYQIIKGVSAGMHLHCAAWAPQSRNGESNVLFISFGDKTAGHVCRVPNFDQLSVGNEDYSGFGWNYMDSQVFAVWQQPTTMWADNGKIYFLARDNDGTVLVSPDDVFSPHAAFEDSFAPYNSTYAGTGYDASVVNRVAFVGNLTEGAIGQYGIYVGNPTDSQQMFRFARGVNETATSSYVGYSAVYGSSEGDKVVVTGDSFGAGMLTNTWVMRTPTLTNIQTFLVANAGTNLIPNANFLTNNGFLPGGWSLADGTAASVGTTNDGNVYGDCYYWRVLQTNTAKYAQYNLNLTLTNVISSTPLCISYAYCFPNAITATYSAPAALRVEWRSATSLLRIDAIGGLQRTSANQWRMANYRAIPPTNATQVKFNLMFTGYNGAVDVALPVVAWKRFVAPTATTRAADVLDYAVSNVNWAGYSNSHVEFLVLPLWPTDLNPFAEETVCSILSDDGLRCLLTWDYTLGFRAFFQDNTGRQLAVLKLGQLRTLTRFDPCRFSVDCQQSILTVKLDAGGDVLQAIGIVPAINSFKPVKIRLGGDQFSSSSLGWEGYYALLSCAGSY